MYEQVQITVKAINGNDGKFYIVTGGQYVPVDESEIVFIDYGHDNKVDDDETH